MLEIRGLLLCHMLRWDRYVLRPRIWMETSRSGTVPHIGPYNRHPGRTNVRELVSFCVVVPGDVVELATVEVSFEFVVELLVGRHVVSYCVAVSHRLLDDEVGVSVNYEASGSACFGHAHAMEECLVFCFVVGGVTEVDLEDIFQLCSFRGDEHDSCPSPLLSFGPIEEH